MIRKLENGQYRVLSQKGKNLGTYKSKEEAEKRLKQVEFFKFLQSHRFKRKKKKAEIDQLYLKVSLGELTDPTYAEVMRKINKSHPDKLERFMKLYKEAFDAALEEGLENKESVALLEALAKLL